MMMTRILTVLTALTLSAPSAFAQGGAQQLQTLLTRVPVAALDGGEGAIVAGVGNGDAVRWIAVRSAQAGLSENTPNRFAALRSAPPGQQAVIASVPDEALRAAVGLRASDWVDTFEVTQGNVRLGGMDIFPDIEMRLRGAFFSRGMTEEERAGALVMWQGDADHVAAEERIDPAHPFGGDAGLPLRFAFMDDRALWATGWTTLDQMMFPSGPNLASRADAQAILAGLRRAGNLGGVVSVRCWLRNGGSLPIAGAETGPVEGLALVDFANRETEASALVLLMEDGTDVEALATRLGEAWPILSDIVAPAEPELTSGNGTITVTISGGWGDDGAASNAGYQAMLAALAGGRLGFLLTR